MRITIVAGARPNFMKIAPIIRSIHEFNNLEDRISYRLVHTGQHFDQLMSGNFLAQLNIPEPDINLGCGGGFAGEQTAAIMLQFEKELLHHPTDYVLVVGDVNSTMACAITAKKQNIQLVHVEAGIRSGDRTMPEEINRLVTDAITDIYFTTTHHASQQLIKENVPIEKIHFVGNTMIDTLYYHLGDIQKPSCIKDSAPYFLLTLHRPSNVDNLEKLKDILSAISMSTKGYKVIFPVHPRTQQVIESGNLKFDNIELIPPQGYFEFIYLIQHSKGIITDSGGITEEATVLHKPCLTMRNSTERPETVTMGTNELIGDNLHALSVHIDTILQNKWKKGMIPLLWDGKTSKRIVETLYRVHQKHPMNRKKEQLIYEQPA